MKIIVGLGNPGTKYALTRHNIGFAVVDALLEGRRTHGERRAHKAQVAEIRLAGDNALLVKPQTYMNLSGESVLGIMNETGAAPTDLIVVHDDLDLDLGMIRIKRGGGDGGHNGVASIIGALETGSFLRVKLGVGRPPGWMDAASYVLSPFAPDELETARDAALLAAEAVASIMREGPVRAMDRYNRKKPSETV